MRTYGRIVPPFLTLFIMGLTDKMKGALIGAGGGLLNTGINFLFNRLNQDDEKQWWYEQQKYLEEHNSPAYQSMKMRQAGLNPYTELSSVPLGNVDSSLPRMNASQTFDVNAIQNSLLLDAQRENLEADTEVKTTQAGLNEEKILTETEWRSNIIQQTLNLQQEYQLGLITEEEMRLRLDEYKDALDQGYNTYLIDMELKESNKNLNESLADLYVKEGEKVDQEKLLLSVRYACESLHYTLDLLYAELERKAQLDSININTAFTTAEYQEFLDTQDVRISLVNVQKAFAKLAIDEAERQDALSRIVNEKDKLIAQQMLEAVENGESLDYWMLNMIERDPGAFLSSMTNILSAFAPNVNYNTNRSTSTITRTR